jgi:hypothetical protein
VAPPCALRGLVSVVGPASCCPAASDESPSSRFPLSNRLPLPPHPPPPYLSRTRPCARAHTHARTHARTHTAPPQVAKRLVLLYLHEDPALARPHNSPDCLAAFSVRARCRTGRQGRSMLLMIMAWPNTHSHKHSRRAPHLPSTSTLYTCPLLRSPNLNSGAPPGPLRVHSPTVQSAQSGPRNSSLAWVIVRL